MLFVVAMSVTALANAPTVRLEGAWTDGADHAYVRVFVDAEGTAGISALVVDINLATATQLQRTTGTRLFTEAGETTERQIMTGIVPGPAFNMPTGQFVEPPAGGTIRLYFEMDGNGVLTSNALAATIRFGVGANPTGAETVTPVVRHAYRWTTGDTPYERITDVGTVNGSFLFTQPTLMIGDLDGDNRVDLVDLVIMTQYAMDHPGVTVDYAVADLDEDGNVDLVDLVLLVQHAMDHPGACLGPRWPEQYRLPAHGCSCN